MLNRLASEQLHSALEMYKDFMVESAQRKIRTMSEAQKLYENVVKPIVELAEQRKYTEALAKLEAPLTEVYEPLIQLNIQETLQKLMELKIKTSEQAKDYADKVEAITKSTSDLTERANQLEPISKELHLLMPKPKNPLADLMAQMGMGGELDCDHDCEHCSDEKKKEVHARAEAKAKQPQAEA